MDFLSTMEPNQIASGILLLVLTPLLFLNIRKWMYATHSVRWPKTNGAIVEPFELADSRTVRFSYTYEVNGRKFKGNRPFFYNSPRDLSRKKINELEQRYTEGAVEVYYNPENPKVSTLEPGRKDGLLSALIFLIVLVSLSIIVLYDASIIMNLLGSII